MSYISILLPAFHFNTLDKNRILKLCKSQFNISEEQFELINFNDNTKNNNFAIKFKESSLSLNSIENLIYQSECVKSISEKTFESLKLMNNKLLKLENHIKSFHENGYSEEVKKSLLNDNLKLKERLKIEVENFEKFKLNTEKILNKIREQFTTIISELETMRKKNNKVKPFLQREITNYNIINSVGKKIRLNSNSSEHKNGKNLIINNNGVPKLNFV
jgi:hypothetical protein